MKITPSKSQPNTGVVRMEFEWQNDGRTSNKHDEIRPPRSPRLPTPSKVTRICGNLTTSHWLKVCTLTEGCGQVQVAGAGGLADVAFWSIASIWRCQIYFRFSPDSRRSSEGSASPRNLHMSSRRRQRGQALTKSHLHQRRS